MSSLTDTGWQEVVGGAGPINHAPDRDASWVSLAGEADEPYVAWQEWNGHDYELRVSEWEPGGDELDPVVSDDFTDDFADDEGSDEAEPVRLVLVPARGTFRGRARHAVRMRYVLDRRAAVTVSVYRGRKRVARVRRTGRAGRNAITWKGRAGRYTVRFAARDAEGVTARAKAKLVLRR